MILAIDIGNTNIVIGCIDQDTIYFVERMSTDQGKTDLEYAIGFKTVLELYQIASDQVKACMVSSVVPPINNTIKRAIRKILGLEAIFVGPGVKTGLNITIDNPGQLGCDLVVNAVAAIQDYPTEGPLIVIDMGTATTMSVIDRKKNYIGGVIIPGIRVALDALVGRTAQLRRISLEAPKKTIGRNTIDCMKSGAILGNASMIDGMIDRIQEELGENATVIATGGLARFITEHCRHEIIFDDALLLKGLLYIYEKNR